MNSEETIPTAVMIPVCPNCFEGIEESKHGWNHDCQGQVVVDARIVRCLCVCYEAA